MLGVLFNFFTQLQSHLGQLRGNAQCAGFLSGSNWYCLFDLHVLKNISVIMIFPCWFSKEFITTGNMFVFFLGP